MGFLPQYGIIKKAITSSNGIFMNGDEIYKLEQSITTIDNKTYGFIYNATPTSSTAEKVRPLGSYLSLSTFGVSAISGVPGDRYPFGIYLSEDSDEDRLIIDDLDHLVTSTSYTKLWENNRFYTVVTFTNNSTEFVISTIRLCMILPVTTVLSGGNRINERFMIYSEPIDPITIGTGETVQIKIEV